jgi:hypothetical protein
MRVSLPAIEIINKWHSILDTKSNSKRCIACWESIPSQSSLCAKCGSFQRNWKNDLRYWSTIVGLVVFVCSALAYLAATVPELWRIIAWKDGVKVVDAILPGYIVLESIGDGDVFVRKLYWAGTVTGTTQEITSNGTIPINKTISKAQRWESIELKRPETKKKGFEGEYMKSHEVSKELRMQLWNKARSSNDECWDIKLQLTKTEAMLEMERSAKQEFWSIPIQGILYLDTFHTNKTLEERFNLLGFVVKNTNGKC